MMEGPLVPIPKSEPVSDIDTVVVDSLKALDPEWPIREAAVIVANGPAALAAKAAATIVPIVFATGSDPVGDGLDQAPGSLVILGVRLFAGRLPTC
jgi:hypothetical protein